MEERDIYVEVRLKVYIHIPHSTAVSCDAPGPRGSLLCSLARASRRRAYTNAARALLQQRGCSASGSNGPARTRALARLDPSDFRRRILLHSSRKEPGCTFHILCCPERQRARSNRREPILLTRSSCTSPPQIAQGNALPTAHCILFS